MVHLRIHSNCVVFIIVLCGCYLLTKETNSLTYYNYSVSLSKNLSPFMKLHISLLSQKKQNCALRETKRSQSLHKNKTWWCRPYSDGYRLGDCVRFQTEDRCVCSTLWQDRPLSPSIFPFIGLLWFSVGILATWNVVTTSSENVAFRGFGLLGLRGTRWLGLEKTT